MRARSKGEGGAMGRHGGALAMRAVGNWNWDATPVCACVPKLAEVSAARDLVEGVAAASLVAVASAD